MKFILLVYDLPNRTILENMSVILSTPKEIVMFGFTLQGSKLSTVSNSEIIYRNIKIIRCNFHNSTIILFNVDLTIGNSNFLHSPSTVLTVTSSIITLEGTVTFSYNVGVKGGALALIGSTMIIARKASLTFVGNRSLKTGGAIFNVSPFLSVSNCFYQLKDYRYSRRQYNIKFINNSTNNGGHHIYGASLISSCYASLVIGEQSYKIIKAGLISLEPGYNTSLSPVSDDVSRVCMIM